MSQVVKTLAKGFATCLLSCFGVAAFAANLSTGDTTLTSVQAWQDGAIIVGTTESTKTNPASCSYTGTYRVSSAGTELLHTQLLSALISSSTVRLTILGSGCTANSPVIVAVTILK